MARWQAAREALGLDVREPQERLFQGVVDALDARTGPVFGQAPCGGGKSLLVVPASAYVRPEGRVIYSAYTKSQQAQMMANEALAGLGIFPAIVQVRGRTEYVCLRRWRKAGGMGPDPQVTGDGMRADLGRALSDAEWRDVRSESDAGCGTACGDADYANRARARAQEPGALVVVNHSVLALDYALRFAGRDEDRQAGPLIGYGPEDVLVLDEAHQAPDAFRNARGASITPTRLRRLVNLAALERVNLAAVGLDGPRALDEALAGLLDRDPRAPHVFLGPETDPSTLDRVTAWLAGVERATAWAPEPEGAERVRRVAARIRGDLADLLKALDNPDLAAWAERKGPSLEVRPLDVSDFAQGLLAHGAAAVATSATVAGYPLDELGGGTLVEVGSPFDLAAQRIAVVTTNDDKDDEERRLADLRTLVGKARGGVLVLAPTNKIQVGGRWRSAADVCTETLSRAGYRVGQQTTPEDVPDLVDGLRSGRFQVVVATASMREGIDLPGDALGMVILYGLPWPYMGDPLLQARMAKVGEARKWDLLRPMMLVNLEQAVGRLIRTADDWGHVALLDGRRNAVRDFQALTKPSPVRWLGIA